MLIKFDKFKNINSYNAVSFKKIFFFKEILKLNNHHIKKSQIFADIIKFKDKNKINKIEEIPFLPTRLFKQLNLKTIKDGKIFKALESSGTSGDVSKFFLINTMQILKSKF